MKALFLLLALTILTSSFFISEASAAIPGCSSFNTPKIRPPDSDFLLYEGKLFTHDFDLKNANESGSYGFSVLSGTLEEVYINSSGYMRIIPGANNTRKSTIAVLYYQGSCVDIVLVNVSILTKPVFMNKIPVEQVVIVEQGVESLFSIAAITHNPDKRMNYDWYFDEKRIEGEGRSSYYFQRNTSQLFNGNQSLIGKHTLSVTAYDFYGLASSNVWNLTIVSSNKKPYLRYNVSNAIIFKNTETPAYDLNDYFVDPENALLTFTWKKIVPSFNSTTNLSYADIRVNISQNGLVNYYPETNSTGVAYFIFYAMDPGGKSAESNTVRVDVIERIDVRNITSTQIREFCGDSQCNALENCSVCPEDCGPCKGDFSGCRPEWNCTDWSPCQMSDFQTRTCVDINLCNDNRSMPSVNQTCKYSGNCSDKLQNGLETGIDCGGPCDPCPTCNDSIKNQGEIDVDCGGPCPVCASCTNKIKDHNETDVDCGGGCLGCEGNMSCLVNKDCLSLRCEYMKCTFASCSDFIKNCHSGSCEAGIDCGGPCSAVCSTCKDGVQNGNEEGVDCGGMCAPCPNCQDKKKNGFEKLTDCGGECQSCTLADYLLWLSLPITIFLVLIVSLIGFFVSYMIYALSFPDKAQYLYEHNSTFVMITGLHNFCRRWRRVLGKRPLLDPESHSSYRAQLSEVSKRPNFTNKELHETFMKIFSAIFTLPDNFDDKIFFRRVRATGISPFIKILFIGYYRKISILKENTFIPRDEMDAFIAEMKFLLMEISKV